MQKKLLKLSFIIFITLLFLLKINVKATSDANLEDLIVGTNTASPVTDPEVRAEDGAETPEEPSDEEPSDVEAPEGELPEEEPSDVEAPEGEQPEEEPEIGSTVADNETNGADSTAPETTSSGSTYTPPATVKPTQSYSTVATIPEANLSLNNILNVILIAVGVILILLAIAILIRLR